MISPRAMVKTQFRALLRAARERRSRAAGRDLFLIYFLGSTGLRASEALDLRVADLVLDASPPLVRVRTLKRKRPAPGTRQSPDDVYMDSKAARFARAWVDRGLPHVLGRAVREDDFLIPGGFGMLEPGQMTRRNAHRIFMLYARRAGLPRGITLHSLRHYRGSILYSTTKDLQFVREQLRHTSIANTQRYLHTDPAKIARYLDAAEADRDLERELED